MKKSLKNLYFLAVMLFWNFAMFAQEPGDDTGDGTLEGDDPIPHGAPIDSRLILLAAIGVLFVLYTYRKSRKTA